MNVASGVIELVQIGAALTLQFNCSCADALSTCKAACCRMRPHFTAALEPDEVGHYKSELNPDGKWVLAGREDGRCVYLDDWNLCTEQERKPKACREYHCSPEGNLGDEAITHRQNGWLVAPALENVSISIRKGK